MKRLPRSRLFLFELTIDLVFFCICAAVCLTLLARAQSLTRQSEELQNAMLAAENTAEAFAASDGGTAADGLTRYFDADWAETEEPDAAYRLSAGVARAENGLAAADIRVLRVADGETVYQLETKRFAKGAGG